MLNANSTFQAGAYFIWFVKFNMIRAVVLDTLASEHAVEPISVDVSGGCLAP